MAIDVIGVKERLESISQPGPGDGHEKPDLYLVPPPLPTIYEEDVFAAAVARQAERIHGPHGAMAAFGHVRKAGTLEQQLSSYSSPLNPSEVPVAQVHATREQLRLQYAILSAAGVEYPPHPTAGA